MAVEPLILSIPAEDIPERIGRGDTGAFEEFFRAEYARLCSFLAHQVGNRAQAEELAQDVFLRLWRAHARVRADTPLRAYLYRAARNAVANYRRRAALERVHATAVEPAPSQSWSADARLRAGILWDAADAAIRELPERCRLIFDMSRRRHLTHAEIADALDISPRTVETQIGRALRLLRRRLAPLLD